MNTIQRILFKSLLLLIIVGKGQTLLAQLTDSSPVIKEYAQSAPRHIAKSPAKLAEYLTENESSEAQKALNIYTWMIHNITYDVRQLGKVKKKAYSIKQTLRRKKGICYQYTALFDVLCANAGIASLEIPGYSKGLLYDVGDTFYEVDHSWNGIRIDSAWYLVDVTWGSGKVAAKTRNFSEFLYKHFRRPFIKNKYEFIQEADYSYFLRDPGQMIIDHLPADPLWQLLEFPISTTTFEHQEWNKYRHVVDTIRPARMDSIKCNGELSKRALLSPNQYALLTAELANSFNPKNNQLLAAARLASAQIHNSVASSSMEKVANTDTTIQNLEAAISLARMQLRTIGTESKKKASAAKNTINAKLRRPSVSRSRSISNQIVKTNRYLGRQKSNLVKQRSRITELEESMHEKESARLVWRKSRKDVDTLKIEENCNSINLSTEKIRTYQDTLIVLMDELDRLKIKNSSYQASIHLLYRSINQQLHSTIRVIIDNSDLPEIVSSDGILDNLKNEIKVYVDSLNQNKAKIPRQTNLIKRRHVQITSEARKVQNLIRQNCSISNGSACDSLLFLMMNDQLEAMDQKNLDLLRQQYEVEKTYYSHFLALLDKMIEQRKSLKIYLSFIDHYDKQMINRIHFAKRESEYEMMQVIKRSTKAIEKSSLARQKLEHAIDEENASISR